MCSPLRIHLLCIVGRHGYYRDAWLMPNPSVGTEDEPRDRNFVLKQMKLPFSDADDDGEGDGDHMPNHRSFGKIQREAVIMERLTSSPRIISSYGHCGLSVLAETTPIEVANFIVPNSGHARQSAMDALPQIRSLNNYTVVEKLDMALDSKYV